MSFKQNITERFQGKMTKMEFKNIKLKSFSSAWFSIALKMIKTLIYFSVRSSLLGKKTSI